jgi:hypothetical protein
MGAVLLLCSAAGAEDQCPFEIKLLLSPSELQTVIASLGFGKPKVGQIYFFDTDALDLQKQGLVVRVRAAKDLTLKVRVPKDNNKIDTSRLHEQFSCEIDRTGAGVDTSYAIRSRYKPLQVPAMGADIFRLLSPAQKKLLQEARISIDWALVTRIASIQSTNWETTSQSPFGKLVLELWETPAGDILELSAKVGPDAGQSKYNELQRLVNRYDLTLSARQGTKTSIVLEMLTHPAPPPL